MNRPKANTKRKRKTTGTTTAKRRTAAKRNPPMARSVSRPTTRAYTRTIRFKDGRIRSVHVIDAGSGRSIAKYKSLSGAKRYAAANGIRLEVNNPKPAARKVNAKRPAVARKSNSIGMTKVAWVRDPNIPPGKPGRGKLRCPCGNAPWSKYGDGKDVRCKCGTVYSSTGWVQRVGPKSPSGLTINPTAAKRKSNGIVSRYRGRRKAAREYKKELRLKSAIERSRKRRSAAEAKAAKNPAGRGGRKTVARSRKVNAKKPNLFIAGSSHTLAAAKRYAADASKNLGEPVWIVKIGRMYRTTQKPDYGRLVAHFDSGKQIRLDRKPNPKTTARRRTYEMFQGRPASTVRHLPVSRFAPPRMDQLGDLIEVKLADGQVIRPNPKRFKLCAAGGKLWIAGGKFAKANPAGPANELNPIERVAHVVYATQKPHHGDHAMTHYIHRLGDETGHLPMLAVDREGFPVIRGGRYKIEARGIVN